MIANRTASPGGGAYTLGAALLPLFAMLINSTAEEPRILLGPTMAAAGIALALGEGIGRLGCISFGCCYGIPLAECPPVPAKLILYRGFQFLGETKKASYEGGFSGVLLAPLQAMATVVLTLTAFVAALLFLQGWYRASFVTSIVVSQLWRFASEQLRADDRGAGRISAYQWMALGLVALCLIGAPLISVSPPPAARLSEAALQLWNPLALVALQTLWVALFVYTGCSRTTASSLRLHLCRDRI